MVKKPFSVGMGCGALASLPSKVVVSFLVNWWIELFQNHSGRKVGTFVKTNEVIKAKAKSSVQKSDE